MGCGRCLRGGASVTLDIFLKIQAVIEAPLVAGEIPLGLLYRPSPSSGCGSPSSGRSVEPPTTPSSRPILMSGA
jgi:hypothetical protein